MSPRNGRGMPVGHFLYAVFPRSRSMPPWQVGPADLNRMADDRMRDLGGWQSVEACFP